MWSQANPTSQGLPYRPANTENLLIRTDAQGKPLPLDPPKPKVGLYAVLDSSKCVDGVDCGPVISLHKSLTAARKAAAKVKHSRVLQLKANRAWAIGDHANGRTDVIFSNVARFG